MKSKTLAINELQVTYSVLNETSPGRPVWFSSLMIVNMMNLLAYFTFLFRWGWTRVSLTHPFPFLLCFATTCLSRLCFTTMVMYLFTMPPARKSISPYFPKILELRASQIPLCWPFWRTHNHFWLTYFELKCPYCCIMNQCIVINETCIKH